MSPGETLRVYGKFHGYPSLPVYWTWMCVAPLPGKWPWAYALTRSSTRKHVQNLCDMLQCTKREPSDGHMHSLTPVSELSLQTKTETYKHAHCNILHLYWRWSNHQKIVQKRDWGHLLTLTLTSYDLESHIIVNCLIDVNKYHYLVCGCIVFDCGRTDGRMYRWMDVRMDIFTGFIRSSYTRWPKNSKVMFKHLNIRDNMYT